MTNFQDLLTVMDRSVVDRLSSVYRSVNDIDLFIGGLVERHLPGSMLGPVFSCIIADQFARSKEGDRFFYEHDGQPNSFSLGNLKLFDNFKADLILISLICVCVFIAQLQEIRKMSLAAIIYDNSDYIIKVQPLVFRHPSPT